MASIPLGLASGAGDAAGVHPGSGSAFPAAPDLFAARQLDLIAQGMSNSRLREIVSILEEQ
jgi:hypothetical protein